MKDTNESRNHLTKRNSTSYEMEFNCKSVYKSTPCQCQPDTLLKFMKFNYSGIIHDRHPINRVLDIKSIIRIVNYKSRDLDTLNRFLEGEPFRGFTYMDANERGRDFLRDTGSVASGEMNSNYA